MGEQNGYAQSLLENIQAQPANIAQLVEYHLGDGLPTLLIIAKALRTANQIIFSGMGASQYVSITAAKHLAMAGIPASAWNAADLLHYTHPACRGIVVLISRSGESAEVIRLLTKLQAQGVIVVGVTNEPTSTLASLSDLPLLLNSDTDRVIAIQTYTATLLVLLMLVNLVIEQHPTSIFYDIADLMDKTVTQFVQESDTWQRFFSNAKVIYLLGRGPSMTSVHQGALLFHEIAKVPAVGMEAGEFRHGPIEVASDEISAFVFAPRDATYALNVALARDMHQFRIETCCIGAVDDVSLSTSMCWVLPADAPTQFAPLLEIIPIQLAAYRLAGWRGVEAGRLNITPTVTTQELGFK